MMYSPVAQSKLNKKKNPVAGAVALTHFYEQDSDFTDVLLCVLKMETESGTEPE